MVSIFKTDAAEEICDVASPFLVHLVYKVASMHLRIAHESPTVAALENLELLKHTLKVVGGRWHCACKYLSSQKIRLGYVYTETYDIDNYLSLLEKQEILLVVQ